MSWRDIVKNDEIKKNFLNRQPNGEWKLSTFMRGANVNTYTKEYIDHAIKQIGITWGKADMNSSDGELLEIYLNRGNSGYAYSSEQRKNILIDAKAPFLREHWEGKGYDTYR